MRGWFGEHWGAVVCNDEEHVKTPVGTPCLWCEEAIEAGDRGMMVVYAATGGTAVMPLHLECELRQILGGINHQKKLCTCCGGVLPPDPPNLRKRECARLTAAYARVLI